MPAPRDVAASSSHSDDDASPEPRVLPTRDVAGIRTPQCERIVVNSAVARRAWPRPVHQIAPAFYAATAADACHDSELPLAEAAMFSHVATPVWHRPLLGVRDQLSSECRHHDMFFTSLLPSSGGNSAGCCRTVNSRCSLRLRVPRSPHLRQVSNERVDMTRSSVPHRDEGHRASWWIGLSYIARSDIPTSDSSARHGHHRSRRPGSRSDEGLSQSRPRSSGSVSWRSISGQPDFGYRRRYVKAR